MLPEQIERQSQHVCRAGEMAKASEPYEVLANRLLWEHAAKYPAHKQLVTVTLTEVASEQGYAKLHDYCSYHMLCVLDSWQGPPHHCLPGVPVSDMQDLWVLSELHTL